ncbi:GDSL esterase/lipase CPRD49 [Rhynchospora pubera]|uniref:GDSL esterase/lipase CPRD49 n=1 Tax=Rhynchospora pubera TaxID=906938 RepID=A0AAV8F828_9POAL|nr:GDSL esterase/lipase CPRD49 [Rhynchospora pubera]
MVGPARPVVVLFGSLIMQYRFGHGGVGRHSLLTSTPARQMWFCSKQALQVLPTVFPKLACGRLLCNCTRPHLGVACNNHQFRNLVYYFCNPSTPSLSSVFFQLNQDALVQPSLVIVYFGGNDLCTPHPYGFSSYMPLSEYKENIRQIGLYIRARFEGD